jgi:D-alanine-D-alanine ligase-like ATP-grasp enzyme
LRVEAAAMRPARPAPLPLPLTLEDPLSENQAATRPQRHRAGRSPSAAERDVYRSGFLDCIRDAAGRLGLDVELVDQANGRLIRVSAAFGRGAFFGASPLHLWPFNGAMAASIAADKELTLRLLKRQGILVPATAIAFYDTQRYSHLENPPANASWFVQNPPLELPVVIKPNDSHSGRGLTFVYEATSLGPAVACAAQYSNGVLMQELLCGADVRLFSFRGRGILRIERTTAGLVADGRSSVLRQLEGFPAETEEARLSLQSYVARYADEVPPKGQQINAYPAANYSVTRRAGTMSRALSDEEQVTCRTVYACLDLAFCAIDCVADGDGALRVLEVNANPGVEMLYRDRENQVASETIDFLVSEAVRGC